MLKIAPTRSIPANEINVISILRNLFIVNTVFFSRCKVTTKTQGTQQLVMNSKASYNQQNRNAAIEEIDSQLFFSLFLLMCLKEIVYLCA
jgi:hypothetical protein